MNELQIFNSSEFGEIRTVVENGEPMFCLTDVCRSLELTNPAMVKARLNEKGISSIDTLTKGGMQKLLYINEANLYKIIFQSRKESAERFTDWVTGEVLPSIRKNGGYISGQETLTDDELMEKAVLVAQRKIAERDMVIECQRQKIERMKPKETFADAVATSHTSILIGELAKILKPNGIETGEKRLFTWLRDSGYLIKRKGIDYNSPTQKSMELGLFEVKETAINHSDGHVTISKTTKVTGKGQQYFINKFLNAESMVHGNG